MLKEGAYRLKRSVRAEHTIARLSGDEFAIVLAGVGRFDAAEGVLGEIVAAFRPGVRMPQRIQPVTLSIGACLYQLDGTDAQTLLRCADSAMYQAKNAGGNCWRFFGAEKANAAGARAAARVLRNNGARTRRSA